MTRDNHGQDSAHLEAIDLLPLSENPLVSVLISSYNYESFVGKSIQSVLDQTFRNFELIICDDGSIDSSIEIIRTFLDDSRIRLIQKGNGGQASALNAAYEVAKGEIICLLDSDDVFCSRKLEQVVAAFAGALQCGLCIHKVRLVSEKLKPISPPFPMSLESGWIGPRALGEGAHSQRIPQTLGLSFREAVATHLFPMPVQFRTSPDAFLVRAAFFITNIVSVNDVLALYRVHGANILGMYNPSAEAAKFVIDDALKYTQALRVFLKLTYGESVSSRLKIEDSPTYWNNLLAYHILEGEIRYDVQLDDVREMVGKLPKGRNRYIWWVLVRMPRFLAKPFFKFWWGKSRFRRFTRKLIYHTNW
ncbi:MAG: glycosyltransferase [Candidatus Brocadiales bacterium]|nr:glycosyltransferase [Candidatus Bathyanammoxibius sp.]